jgi:cytochrome c oxidase cbb3-type subunit III
MSTGWSFFVIALTLVNIVACVWLMWWSARPKHSGERIGGGADTGHIWDGDLRELNNPMPRWWLGLFYITIVFSLGYLVLYPGLGAFRGLKHWTQASQYDVEKAAAEKRAEAWFAPFAQMPLPQLSGDAHAMSAARNLFLNNCAQCHGSDGGGGRGFPNLTDHDWLWGGEPDTIVQTISAGRTGAMPPWGAALGDQGVKDVIAYVRSLSGGEQDAARVAAGKTQFDTYCVACHGADAHGNAMLGAPNLSDSTWLYGGDEATLHETIVNGRSGQMPAFAEKLGPDRVRLLAAYVMRLSADSSDDRDEHSD